MKERLFRFKQFQVHHSRCAIPIGVDGVLIGAWAYASGDKVIDVGAGCGVIALMLAQRNKNAEIVGIDIDRPSVEEASENFLISPWGDRLRSVFCGVCDVLVTLGKFDVVVSNPPFYKAGVDPGFSSRMLARHQGELSPFSLVDCSESILNEEGVLSMIIPTDMSECLLKYAEDKGFMTKRICRVAHHDGAVFKRTMIELKKYNTIGCSEERLPTIEDLILFKPDGEPTERHRELCGDFYLKF